MHHQDREPVSEPYGLSASDLALCQTIKCRIMHIKAQGFAHGRCLYLCAAMHVNHVRLPASHTAVLSLSLLTSCFKLTAMLLGPASAALEWISIGRPQRKQHPRKRQLVVPAQHSQVSESKFDNAGQLAARATRHTSCRLFRTAACIGSRKHTCLRCFWRAFLAALRLLALTAAALSECSSAACSSGGVVWYPMPCSESAAAFAAAAAAEAASLAAACSSSYVVHHVRVEPGSCCATLLTANVFLLMIRVCRHQTAIWWSNALKCSACTGWMASKHLSEHQLLASCSCSGTDVSRCHRGCLSCSFLL